VHLVNLPAHDFTGIPENYFDVVVLNSIVQYFPSARYLQDTLKGIMHLLKPDGKIYVGDVRNLDTLELFHSAVLAGKADEAISRDRLRRQVDNAVRNEKELLVSPSCFDVGRGVVPEGWASQVIIKENDLGNELSGYRYDVILKKNCGNLIELSDARELIWGKCVASLGELATHLDCKRPEALRVTGIPNPRLAVDVQGWQCLEGNFAARYDVGPIPIDLDRARTIAHERGFDFAVTWSGFSKSAGALDILFWKKDSRYPTGFFRDRGDPDRMLEYTNSPAVIDATFLRIMLRENLPAHMMPWAFVRLKAMPLTPNGKLDRRALPEPGVDAYSSAIFEAPRGMVEQALAQMWSDVLGVATIGRHDNFFDMGGHSLLAVRVISRIRREFAADVPLTVLFKTPRLDDFSAHVEFLIGANEAASERGAPYEFSDEGFV
jgi:SAM-dependent methyltransferase